MEHDNMKSLGWKFLNKETYGNSIGGNLKQSVISKEEMHSFKDVCGSIRRLFVCMCNSRYHLFVNWITLYRLEWETKRYFIIFFKFYGSR